jgi:hypothetical protein
MSDFSVRKDIAEKLIDIGTFQPPEFEKVIPISGSEMEGKAGSKDNMRRTYVGHVAYSPDFGELVYQVEKEQHHILHSVEGQGFTVSRHIIDELRRTYDAKYVFGGMRESNRILVFPIDSFTHKWQTRNYDEQLYARLDADELYEIPDAMSDVFSDMPSLSNRSITIKEAEYRVD